MARAQGGKAIGVNEMRARASAFAQKHVNSTDEKREAQTWWNDFFDVFGASRYGRAIFEATAKRFSTGNDGSIDCFMPGVFIGEAKSRGLIAKAHGQMVDYLAGGTIKEGEQPRYMLATDMQRVDLYDRDAANYPEPALSIVIDDLADHLEAFSFIAGGFTPREEINLEAASVKAAKRLAALQDTLYKPIEDDDPDRDQLEVERAVFMTRLLFLMYGDDVDGLWARGQFYRLIDEQTSENGSDVQGALLSLFQVLAEPERRRSDDLQAELAAFPYVNGGLFNDYSPVPSFNRLKRMELLSACRTDWSGLSPAIFGSLFQGLATREQRRVAGEHYTSERNILKALEPLFLDELEERFRASTLSHDKLEALRQHLGTIQVLDPACGCGNFLIVAYRRLADLELRILERQRDLSGDTGRTLDAFTTIDLCVQPHQFRGIEISWWPVKIAETAMFLTQHRVTQALESIGVPPEILPIQDSARIIHSDALDMNWQALGEPTPNTYVVGNPPFLGHSTRTPEQAKQLREAWGRDDISRLDYVTAWHARALDYFGDTAGRWAFVATNSISQGDQVEPLSRPIFDAGWRIRFAHRTFAWESEASGGAAVHCVIIGFDRTPAKPALLFDYAQPKSSPRRVEVKSQINGYLVDAPIVYVEPRSAPLSRALPAMAFGNVPRDGGHLIIEPDDHPAFEADEVAAKYVRPFVGARELIDGTRRWCLWLVDLEPADVAKSALLRGRLEDTRAWRLSRTAKQVLDAAATPHLFWHRPHRDIPHLVVPSVSSENRLFVPCALVDAHTIVSNLAFTCEDPDGFAFAVVSSSAFMAWQRAVGGRLESRLRVSNTLTWNTFPLSAPTEAQRQAVIAGGRKVLEARREHADRSLAEHYSPLSMTPSLVAAHRALDRAVNAVLGLPGEAGPEALTARLFELYAAAT